MCKEVYNNSSWGYSHKRGLLETREYLCRFTNSHVRAQIARNDIIFFNGIGLETVPILFR